MDPEQTEYYVDKQPAQLLIFCQSRKMLTELEAWKTVKKIDLLSG